MQRNGGPYCVGGVAVHAVLFQEVAGNICGIDLEALVGTTVGIGESQIVEHRTNVEQLRIVAQALIHAPQGAKEESPTGVVKNQIIGDVAH